MQQQTLIADPIVGVHESLSSEGLAAIKNPGSSAVIWKRKALPRFQNWIDAVAPAKLPRGRVIVPPAMVRQAVTKLASRAGLDSCQERAMLTDDIVNLAAVFARIMDTPYLRLRLDVIKNNACRKFHIDAVTARLICTYRGHATQYGNGAMGEDPDRIHEVPAGSPMILRGTTWPSEAKPGLLHRSPPIEGTGETRLVLVLDPISDIEADGPDGHIL
ncbi:MAG: DUF1826 domain-containing protein [Pseudomonadota bacterium]